MTADSTEGVLLAPQEGRSYVHGSTDIPLSDATIARFLLDTVQRFPERTAVVFREQRIRWTWREFAAEVDGLAAGLVTLGIEPGDRVGIWSPNRVEWLLTQFATARIGAILVSINPAYQCRELEYALNKVSCKALVAAAGFKTSIYMEMLAALIPELRRDAPGEWRSARIPHLRNVIAMAGTTLPPLGVLKFAEVLARGHAARDDVPLAAISAALTAPEPINIQFTSGTTGNPKGATLTHHNIVNNARYIAAAIKLTQDDALCIPIPLYHCFGMVAAVLACVSAGAKMVFPSAAFDPEIVLAAIEEERCTALHGVPTMFIAELNHPEFARYDLSTLRTGIMSGAPCPVETMKCVMQQMHMTEITIAYGMTETSPVSFQSTITDPLEKRITTVGRVGPLLEAKIINTAGEITPVGEIGELCTKGYAVMEGYWGDPLKTNEVVRDGWMHTGDLAVLDADGFCHIVGRLQDMLIRGGENIYPREIEEFLFGHPKIQSVQVFGVPDSKYGEEICVWVMLRTGETMSEDELKEFCRAEIAHYKVPRYVRFVESMPMTVSGKARKFIMREQMMRELQLGEQRIA